MEPPKGPGRTARRSTGPREPEKGEPETSETLAAADVDALIIRTMNERDASLQREILHLRGLVEQVAGTSVLQRVIENGIGDVFDRLGDLTGRPMPADEATNAVLAKIERELSRPPNTDLFRGSTATFAPESM